MDPRLFLLLVYVGVVHSKDDCPIGQCGGKFEECIHNKCVCKNGFTKPARGMPCNLKVEHPLLNICSQNVTCGYGATCEIGEDMCTCKEPGWRVGPNGSVFENTCTAGGVTECRFESSPSKCFPPLFITCETGLDDEDDDGNHITPSCTCKLDHEKFLQGKWDRATNFCEGGISPRGFRIFWIIQNEEPCDDEGMPDYTCGCKQGEDSCDFIVGAKCSGSPERGCYVPPGIICNLTMGICDCDRSKGLIWGENSNKCQVMPGGKCNKTEDCVIGSTCEGSKCSACQGSKVMDPGSGECRLKLRQTCGASTDCPRYSDCIENSCQCMSSDDWKLGYNPQTNECQHSVAFQRCKRVDVGGFAPKCMAGTKCEQTAWNEYRCSCDANLGLEYGKDEDDIEQCTIMENYPCSEEGGHKCSKYTSDEHRPMKCLKDSKTGQFKCARDVRHSKSEHDNKGYVRNGSAAVLGVGLAAVLSY